MGLRVDSLNPLVAQRRLLLQQVESQRRAEQLPVGLRLSVVANDLPVSETRRARIGDLAAVATTTSRSVNLARTADEALAGIDGQLSEIRSLVVRAGDETIFANIGLQTFSQRIARAILRINTIAETTTFRGITLLDGSFNQQFQIGEGNLLVLSIPNLATSELGQGTPNASGFTNLSQVNLAINPRQLAGAFPVIDAAVSDVARVRGDLNAFRDGVLEAAARVIGTAREESSIPEPGLREINLAGLPPESALTEILLQTNILAQTLTSIRPGILLDLLA